MQVFSDSEKPRIFSSSRRIPRFLEWLRYLDDEDHEFMAVLQLQFPSEMSELRRELRNWLDEGMGSDEKLPELVRLVNEAREKREEGGSLARFF